MTQVVLVRHGRTALNRETRYRGQLDPPLDERGLEDAERTASYVAARWPVSAVYSSPLRRAMQTAEALARAQDLQPQSFHPLLDLNFGVWQGLSLSEAEARYPDLHRAWYQAPEAVRFPGGECLDDVRSRVTAGLAELVGRHPGAAIALIGHTVVNRVLLCAVLGLGNECFWRIGQATCAVNVFLVEDDGTKTVTLLNDTSHLQDDWTVGSSGPAGGEALGAWAESRA